MRRALGLGIFLAMLALASMADKQSAIGTTGETVPQTTVFLPLVQMSSSTLEPTPSPTPTPTPVYDSIPVLGGPPSHPPDQHGDLNLALRGYSETTGQLTLLDINGPTDDRAPQLDGIFNQTRGPEFVSLFRVNEWIWNCGERGCRGDPIENPPVTLVGLRATQGEPIFIPTRDPEIYVGNYKALVLHATLDRLTIAYTREDTAAIGYVVHFEEIDVDPTLVTLYQRLDASGRDRLPALRNGERLGNASSNVVKVAIRDTGSFMEPRSRKDWWMRY